MKKKETFLNVRGEIEENWHKWYTTFDIAPDGMTLITGENSGYCTLLTNQGELIWTDKLHKSKVTNIGKNNHTFKKIYMGFEFSPVI